MGRATPPAPMQKKLLFCGSMPASNSMVFRNPRPSVLNPIRRPSLSLTTVLHAPILRHSGSSSSRQSNTATLLGLVMAAPANEGMRLMPSMISARCTLPASV